MLELLAAGMSYEEILADYPDLVKEDLLACLAYAVRVTQDKGGLFLSLHEVHRRCTAS